MLFLLEIENLPFAARNMLSFFSLQALPHWYMYTSIWWYLRVLPVLHRPEVVDIGVNTKKKNMPYA